MKKLLLFLVVILILVTPVSADRVINTEQVEKSSTYTVVLDEMGDVEYIYVNDIFPELVLPENMLDGEKARIHSAYLSEINIWMCMIIDENGAEIDKLVGIGVFLPGETVSESFGSLKRNDVQSIYPRLDFVAPLEAVALDYYLVGPLCNDINYPLFVSFNIEYYWEFSWIVSPKLTTTASKGNLNLMAIAMFGIGGTFVVFAICFVEWDNRRRRKSRQTKNIKEIEIKE